MYCFLYVPATEERKISKAFSIPDCGVILDLEDSVVASEKSKARENAVLYTKNKSNQTVYVRINDLNSSHWQHDVLALVTAQPDALVIPKAENAHAIQDLDKLISDIEQKNDYTLGSTKFHLIFETALGIVNMKSLLTSSERILSASIGMADLCNDLGLNWQDSINGQFPLFIGERTRLVLLSRAFKLEPPWDCVYLRIDDEAGFRNDALLGARIGCQGKHIIHPSQREIVDGIYQPTTSEFQQAQRIIAMYEEAKQKGKGAILNGDMLIDEPVVARARAILQSYEKNVNHKL